MLIYNFVSIDAPTWKEYGDNKMLSLIELYPSKSALCCNILGNGFNNSSFAPSSPNDYYTFINNNRYILGTILHNELPCLLRTIFCSRMLSSTDTHTSYVTPSIRFSV